MKSIPTRSVGPAIITLILSMPMKANAEDFRFTPFLGYRVGGEFEDIATENTLDLDEGESYGFIVGWGEDGMYELSYSLQPTQLSANSTVSSAVLSDVDVVNIMFAGRNVLNQESGGFVTGMVGVSRFDPDSSDLSSETRFALGAGGGFEFPLGKNLDFRIEGRGIATFLDSDGAVFCGSSGGCLVYTESSVLWQFEALTGFTFKF